MISLIVAVDKNNGIGEKNDLPWRIPEDLKYFKKVTTGHPVFMGRKTFDSIGKPLPNRPNFVVTRNRNLVKDGCIVYSGEEFENALMGFSLMKKEIFIIGGAQIFNQTIDYVDKLYVTHINNKFDCDTFFNWNEGDWKLISEEKGIKNIDNPYDYYFRIYERNKSNV